MNLISMTHPPPPPPAVPAANPGIGLLGDAPDHFRYKF